MKTQKILPNYSTSRLAGPAHRPTWKSAVCVGDTQVVVTNIEGTKKEAENAAAKKWLHEKRILVSNPKDYRTSLDRDSDLPSPEEWCIPKPIFDRKPTFRLPKKTYLFVDLENRGDFRHFPIDLEPKSRVIGFVSENKDPFDLFEDKLTLHRIPSSRKDAADLGMVVQGTEWITQGKIQELWILSADNFAKTWQDILTGTHPDVSCQTFANIQNLVHFIQDT
jgi:hypothetical protein